MKKWLVKASLRSDRLCYGCIVQQTIVYINRSYTTIKKIIPKDAQKDPRATWHDLVSHEKSTSLTSLSISKTSQEKIFSKR